MRRKNYWSDIKKDLKNIQQKISNNGTYKNKNDLRKAQKHATIQFKVKELRSIIGKTVHLKKYFANGKCIIPSNIKPIIVNVGNDPLYNSLFKAASLFWSVPISKGYGRRMRFLIIDQHHESLIGILGLMDPVFNLKVRDEWIGWSLEQKYNKLRNVMDCNVLGSVPPYNNILGGKLIASLTFSKEIRNHYKNKYIGKISHISKNIHDGNLALLTVSSALGRSSIYNRVRLPWGQNIEKVGYSMGYGVFQIPNELFEKMKEALIIEDHPYAKGYSFGSGPNWKLRVIRYSLEKTGFQELLNHGIKREVFVLPLGKKSKEFLLSEYKRVFYFNNDTEEISNYWKDRWMFPRIKRLPESLSLNGEQEFQRIINQIKYYLHKNV